MPESFLEYKSTFWKIQYPSDWIVEKGKDSVSFFAKNGVGALQVSDYSKNGEVTEEDLLELASQEIPESEDSRKVKLGEYVGFETSYRYVGHFWRMWFLKKNNIMLFVTYNCEFEDKEVERDTINQIVELLK